MKRSKLLLSLGLVLTTAFLGACGDSADNGEISGANDTAENASLAEERVSYEDGRYRGTFGDRGYQQVSIQFELEDNIVKDINFRHMEHNDIDYRTEESDEIIMGIRDQYVELIEHLLEKDIRDSLTDLYEPEEIVTTEVDGFTGATIRSSKAISAIRDALNRGVYSY